MYLIQGEICTYKTHPRNPPDIENSCLILGNCFFRRDQLQIKAFSQMLIMSIGVNYFKKTPVSWLTATLRTHSIVPVPIAAILAAVRGGCPAMMHFDLECPVESEPDIEMREIYGLSAYLWDHLFC